MGANNVQMQVQINMAYDYAGMEGYKLQPKKSVAIHIKPNSSKPQIQRTLKWVLMKWQM